MPTKIEWADETINPFVGCSKCSPGCDNCYAEKMAYRLSKMSHTAAKYTGVVDKSGRWTGKTSQPDLSVFDRLPQKRRNVFERLAETCIKSASHPGDVVFDPFMGSGTVAVTAERLGRKWLGVELNPDYIEIQQRRLAEINPLLKAVNL